MILIVLGTQDLPFDRPLIKMDELVAEGVVAQPVLAQTGYSPYRPRNYEYQSMMSFEDFDKKLEESDLVISHGGTGSLVGALKKGKKVIAVPRLQKYGEHVDDHQTQIIEVFRGAGMLLRVDEMEDLPATLKAVKTFEPRPFVSRQSQIIELLQGFIEAAPKNRKSYKNKT